MSESNKWMQTDKASCHGSCTERQAPRQLALRLILMFDFMQFSPITISDTRLSWLS